MQCAEWEQCGSIRQFYEYKTNNVHTKMPPFPPQCQYSCSVRWYDMIIMKSISTFRILLLFCRAMMDFLLDTFNLKLHFLLQFDWVFSSLTIVVVSRNNMQPQQQQQIKEKSKGRQCIWACWVCFVAYFQASWRVECDIKYTNSHIWIIMVLYEIFHDARSFLSYCVYYLVITQTQWLANASERTLMENWRPIYFIRMRICLNTVQNLHTSIIVFIFYCNYSKFKYRVWKFLSWEYNLSYTIGTERRKRTANMT